MQVRRALEKAKDLDIRVIAVAHGACWRTYIPQAVAAYKSWAYGYVMMMISSHHEQ